MTAERVRMFAGATLAWLVIAAGCGLGGKQQSAVSAPGQVAATKRRPPVVEVTTESLPPALAADLQVEDAKRRRRRTRRQGDPTEQGDADRGSEQLPGARRAK